MQFPKSLTFYIPVSLYLYVLHHSSDSNVLYITKLHFAEKKTAWVIPLTNGYFETIPLNWASSTRHFSSNATLICTKILHGLFIPNFPLLPLIEGNLKISNKSTSIWDTGIPKSIKTLVDVSRTSASEIPLFIQVIYI